MAINVSSIAPLRQTAAPPLLSAAVSCGRLRIDAGKHCFRKTLVISALPSAGTTVTDGVVPKIPEKNFARTPYVPVYVMALPVYSSFMSSFRIEFNDLFEDGVIEIEVGLGPSGELRYPSGHLIVQSMDGNTLAWGNFRAMINT